MKPGDCVEIAGTALTLEGVEPVVGPNYTAMEGRFLTDRGALMAPQRRSYWVQGTVTTEAAIRTDGTADLHAVIGEGNGSDGWVVRLYHQPLVPWIWGEGTAGTSFDQCVDPISPHDIHVQHREQSPIVLVTFRAVRSPHALQLLLGTSVFTTRNC